MVSIYIPVDGDVALYRRVWYGRKCGPYLEWFHGQKWLDGCGEATWKCMLSIMDCEAEEVYVW